MYTLFHRGSCASVALWLAIFAPSVEAVETETADLELSARLGTETCRCQGEAGPSVARIKQVLSEPLKSTGLDFTEEPLENVVNFLQEEYGIPIQIDEPALEDAGLTREQATTASLREISFNAALRLLLDPHDLTYMIKNEVLLVTTPEEAEANLKTCVYDVRDLAETYRVDQPKGASAWADFNPLIDAIQSCVQTDTWAENGGGEAEIRALRPGLLVVSQTDAAHEEIASLLTVLRATLKSPRPVPAGASGSEGRGGYGRGGGGYGMEGGYGGDGEAGGAGGRGGAGGAGGQGGVFGGKSGGRGGDGGAGGAGGEMEPEREPAPDGSDDPFGQ